MPSAGTQIDNLTSASIAVEQLSNGSIVVAPDDHTEQNMQSFLPLERQERCKEVVFAHTVGCNAPWFRCCQPEVRSYHGNGKVEVASRFA